MSVTIPFERRWVRWALGVAFWTTVGLFYGTGWRGGWQAGLLRSMPQWLLWGLLSPLIIAVDRRLPAARDALLRRALYHLPLSVVFTVFHVYVSRYLTHLLGGDLLGPVFSLQGSFHWNVLIYWLIVGVYGTWDYYSGLKERQFHSAELERMLAQSRLEALRTQLHPHFLFNALNAISAHVEGDPRVARRMLEHLGDLLRLSLEHAEHPEIPLEQELAFLDRYLAIQRVRFEDRLDVSIEVDPGVLGARVPTFILQPLVENAVRHGVAPRMEKGSIRVAAWCENGRLHLRVADNGPGLPIGWKPAESGVGLANTRERLRRLYGAGRHSFSIASEPGAGVRVDLSLPYHES